MTKMIGPRLKHWPPQPGDRVQHTGTLELGTVAEFDHPDFPCPDDCTPVRYDTDEGNLDDLQVWNTPTAKLRRV